ncbi:MAG: alpha/beta hydrolase [Ramlibacter sp.]
MLDPQARALLDLIRERGIPSTHELSPAEARKAYRDRRGYSQPAPPDVASVRDFPVPGPAGALLLREYRPAGSAPGQALPALVYFHGGGWVIGDLDTHDVLCRSLANGAGCAVYAVDYRMGPEHRFPAAVDDALAATRWILASAGALAIHPARVAVGGDSAGGNLAAAVTLALRDAGDALQPAFQLLIYPATDMRGTSASHHENGSGYLLTRDVIDYFQGHYLDATQYADWRASPLLAASHAGLPPALVLTAGFDPLRDEGLAYANALSAAGVPTQYVCFSRQIHGFILMGRIIDEANTAVRLCADVLRHHLSP